MPAIWTAPAAATPLCARVEALLQAHDESDPFLSSPTADLEAAAFDTNLAVSEGPGTTIGRYKLLQLLGEGGFGVVYMAEQEDPVRRKVALKVIKLGMDTKQVIARFEAERQALAMMDHPNIAKVLDAGATPISPLGRGGGGRPYFVMELVRGVPFTEYCDKNNLNTRERLELFIPICNAIQYAHHKGIIHRDIKPANVMVTFHDTRPVPKVIDFGVAKATNHRLTAKTLFTSLIRSSESSSVGIPWPTQSKTSRHFPMLKGSQSVASKQEFVAFWACESESISENLSATSSCSDPQTDPALPPREQVSWAWTSPVTGKKSIRIANLK